MGRLRRPQIRKCLRLINNIPHDNFNMILSDGFTGKQKSEETVDKSVLTFF